MPSLCPRVCHNTLAPTRRLQKREANMRGQTTNINIETRKARGRLVGRHAPHWRKLLAGVALGYRKPENGGAGTWMARWRDGARYRIENLRSRDGAFVVADDHAESDGTSVLSFPQAVDQARTLAKNAGLGAAGRNPLRTVDEALAAYEDSLRRHGKYPKNAVRVRYHLPTALGKLLVAKLTARDFDEWNAKLVSAGLAAGSINRTNNGLRAALNLAKREDERIERAPWVIALERLRDSAKARNVVLADDEVVGIVRAAYEHSTEFGLFVEIAAQTGARPVQISNLTVGDLKMHRSAPRLEMPASKKGGGGEARNASPVSIPLDLALRLQARAKGKLPRALMLGRPDGSSWQDGHADLFRAAVERFDPELAKNGKDGANVTIYALRHTHITRQLKANVPIRVVASAHDTSTGQIERHYSKLIANHTDELTRATLLDFGSNVTALAG
jgi:integrase